MLREIGLGTLLLIILTIVVGVVALMQTTEFGPFATSSIGVTSETALVWGQNADLVVDEEEADAAESDTAAEEDEAEATEEASD
jgi:hypothetical protein